MTQDTNGAAPIFGASAETSGTTQQSETAREPIDAHVRQRLLSVLMAASTALTVDLIAKDMNGEGQPYVAQGRIESALKELGAKVLTSTGDGGVATYALSANARAEIDAPGRTMEARAAVAIVLWGGINYLGLETGGRVAVESTLSPTVIAHAIVRANTEKGPVLDVDLQKSFLGDDNPESPEGMATLIERAKECADALANHSSFGVKCSEDGYGLTGEGEILLKTTGALAVAKETVNAPEAPDMGVEIAELTARLERDVRIAESQKDAAQEQRNKAFAEVALYEKWFSEKGIENPARLVAAQLRATTPEKVFTWKQQVAVEGPELERLCDEMRDLDALIAAREDRIKSDKKASEAALDMIKARRATVVETLTNRGSRTIVKSAFSRVVTVDGVPFREVCSAEEHDHGTVLSTEALATGTQLGIPGVALGGTPVVATPSPVSEPAAPPTLDTGSDKVRRAGNGAAAAATPPATLSAPAPAPSAEESNVAAKGPPLKAMTPAAIRSYLVDHILPAHPEGILLADIPAAILTMSGMAFGDEAARAAALPILSKGAQSARLKGLVAEEITPKGPIYRTLAKSDDKPSAKPKEKAAGKAEARA